MEKSEKIYSDGHGVYITEEVFHTGDQTYRLNGITDIKFYPKIPSATPIIISFFLGAFLLTAGMFSFASSAINIDLGYNITWDELSIIIGSVLITLGLAQALSAQKVKYALHITTAEREKEVIISKDETYVRQVLEALKRAFQMTKTPIHMQTRRAI